MYLSRTFIAQNKVNVAILLFLVMFSIFHFFKPGFAYNNEGGFRPFGIGFRNKTVVPVSGSTTRESVIIDAENEPKKKNRRAASLLFADHESSSGEIPLFNSSSRGSSFYEK